MSDGKVVTIDEIRDLITMDKVKVGDLFSDEQIDEAVQLRQIQSRVKIEMARETEAKEAAINQALADKIKPKEAENTVPGDQTDDTEPLNKYLDPAKNPFIKL
jgi:hypothetical protein